MNWYILHRYLAGECDAEEVRLVEDFLHANEKNRKLIDSLQKIWNVEPGDEIKVDEKAAWNAIHQKISDKSDTQEKNDQLYNASEIRKRSIVRRRYRRTITMVLSAAAVSLIAFLFTQHVSVSNEGEQAQTEFAMQEITTKKGQQTTLRLSDGTLVQLNADSRIEIPVDFRNSAREVHLQGEAYFEVNHNPDKPFVIFSENATTRVLGTKFGIRAYPEEDHTEVVVTEGKVSLGSYAEPGSQYKTQITRNQIGVLTKKGHIEISDVENMYQHLGWKNGKLVFDDTPLSKVRTDLERWYDVNFTVADSLLDDRRVTASFDGEPMEEVLAVITLSMDLAYNREGRNVTFMKK